MEKVECYDVDVAGGEADGSQRRMQFCRLSLQRCLADDGAPQQRSLTVDLNVDAVAKDFVVEWSVFKKMRSWSPGERFQVRTSPSASLLCVPWRVDESAGTSEGPPSLCLPPLPCLRPGTMPPLERGMVPGLRFRVALKTLSHGSSGASKTHVTILLRPHDTPPVPWSSTPSLHRSIRRM
jgi:hypothetical protein